MGAHIEGARTTARVSPAWKPNLNALPAVVNAPRTDAIYNCHSYLTKVPVGAIRPFIEVFTKPSDKLLFDQAPLLLRSFADKASYHAYPVHAPKPPVQITSFDPEPLMPALNVANGRNGSHVAPSFSQTIT